MIKILKAKFFNKNENANPIIPQKSDNEIQKEIDLAKKAVLAELKAAKNNNDNNNNNSNDANKKEAVVVKVPEGDDFKDEKKVNTQENFTNNNEIKENESSTNGEFKAPEVSQYVIDIEHVKEKICDYAEKLNVEDPKYKATELLKIFDEIEITEEHLSLWGGYGGGKLFYGKQNAKNRFKTVVEYAENNASCTPLVKQKMRLITKLIIEKGVKKCDEYRNILLLIAQHGNVCNVMKEVAIGNAYGIMTDKLDDFTKQQSLKEQIYKVLRDYRILLVETLFHSFKMTNNTHYIAGFHNVLAKDIGVEPYNDPNICNPSSSVCSTWKKNVDKRYFATLYTKDNIVNHILQQIKEEKIGYQKIVQFMQDNCPKDFDKMVFLQLAIDIDTGDINPKFICWMLKKMGVFKIKPEDWAPIQKCWDDIKK